MKARFSSGKWGILNKAFVSCSQAPTYHSKGDVLQLQAKPHQLTPLPTTFFKKELRKARQINQGQSIQITLDILKSYLLRQSAGGQHWMAKSLH
jgi:hypothetical protein